MLASLQHPNIVSCVESFVEKGQLYIVMDYCAGTAYASVYDTYRECSVSLTRRCSVEAACS